jgi:sirohydrochlorin cobaltochelatase
VSVDTGMDRTAIVIVGHGSRDACANAELQQLVHAYRRRRPDLDVIHAHVELAEPLLDDALRALAARAQRVVAVPLFLFAAGHVKTDIPLALARARAAHPAVRFHAARALGVQPQLIELARKRALQAAGGRPGADGSVLATTALLAVGRGSSDPDANADFYKLVRLIGEGADFAWVQPSFIGISDPRFAAAAEHVALGRPERIVVLPYFLFAGRLIEQLRAMVAQLARRFPWIRITLAEHLGADDLALSALDEQVQAALAGERPLPCDTCQYRVPIAGVAGQVGGLRALLYSVRHGFTHGQAMPHVHAHRALRKHVLVCGNGDCAERGSLLLIDRLRQLVRGRDARQEIRVTRTSCMGRCGEGPTVAVYPDGVFYRGVTAADAEQLVHEHLFGDRLVARLVDNILQ